MAHPYVAGQPISFAFPVYDWVTEAAVTDIAWSIYYSKEPGGTISLSTAMAHLGSGLYRGAFTPAAAGDHHLWLRGSSVATGRTYNAAGSWRVVASALTPPWQPDDEVELLWAVVDADGEPVATAPTLTESDDPDGNTFAVSIAATATVGAYLATFTPDATGNWSGAATAATTPPRGFGFDIDVTELTTITGEDTMGATLTRSRLGATGNDLRRGDTAVWTWDINKSDDTAYALTGCTLRFTVKSNRGDADADALITNSWVDGGASDGITVNDPLTGLAVHTISASETDSLSPRVRPYFWDIQIEDGNGVVKTFDSDTLLVTGDVTRAAS